MEKVLEETDVAERFSEHDLRATAVSDAEALEHAQALLSHTDTGVLVFATSAGWIVTGKQLVTSFTELAQLDSNGDGIIDASDPGLSMLSVRIAAVNHRGVVPRAGLRGCTPAQPRQCPAFASMPERSIPIASSLRRSGFWAERLRAVVCLA
jgi:hypothetical protein